MANDLERNEAINEDSEDEIDLLEWCRIILHHKVAILLLGLLCAALVFVKFQFFTADTYTSGGMLYVSNHTTSSTSDGTQNAVTKNDLESAQKLSQTCIEILKTRSFLELVSANTSSKVSWEAVQKMLTASIVNETELIEGNATSTSPMLAFDVAESFMKVAPDYIESIYTGSQVEVANSAFFPTSPNDNGQIKYTVLGFLVGLIIGIIYSIIRHLVDKKIHEEEKVSKRYDLPILGVIENVAPNDKKKNLNANAQDINAILSDKSSFDMTETFKTIRTNIMFSIPRSDKGKFIAVVSSVPHEGKTSTAVNLAITFSEMDSKVLLIDCDLRKSKVHRYLKIENGEGISNVLCGFCELEHAIKPNVRSNLDVITAGKTPPNPVEIIDSKLFDETLEVLSKEYDYIIIDTPPLDIVADPWVILKRCDGAVLTVRGDYTTYDMLDSSVFRLRKAQTKVFGIVFIDSDSNRDKKSYYGYSRKRKRTYSYDRYSYMQDDNTKAHKGK